MSTSIPPSSSSPGNTVTRPARKQRRRDVPPRPPNSFILYRRAKHAQLVAEHKRRGGPALSNNQISQSAGAQWRAEAREVREHYMKLAEEEKRRHALQFPGYKYQPRK
ncbi:hypothetical protein CXG81DRAFT_15653, partial [Caulochytrium protostelioides]